MKKLPTTKALMLLAILCITSVGYSQTKVTSGVEEEGELTYVLTRELSESEQLALLKEELEGTYEIQISIPDYHPLITMDMMQQIKEARLPKTQNTIQWDQYTTIVVYPLNMDVQTSHD